MSLAEELRRAGTRAFSTCQLDSQQRKSNGALTCARHGWTLERPTSKIDVPHRCRPMSALTAAMIASPWPRWSHLRYPRLLSHSLVWSSNMPANRALMNIPARYCTGYITDIGLPPPYAPMDFAAWIEVYLGRPLVRLRPAQQRPPDRPYPHCAGPRRRRRASDPYVWLWHFVRISRLGGRSAGMMLCLSEDFSMSRPVS